MFVALSCDSGKPAVYGYDASSNRFVLTGGSAYDNRYLYRGAGAYEWYPAASLYYARARFYLPRHGRWLQPDPIGQAGKLNIYTYCHNDPVNLSDPSGLSGLGALGAWPSDMKWAFHDTGGMEDFPGFGYTAIITGHSTGNSQVGEEHAVRINYITVQSKDGNRSLYPQKLLQRMMQVAAASPIFAKEFEYMMNSKAEFRFIEEGWHGVTLDLIGDSWRSSCLVEGGYGYEASFPQSQAAANPDHA